MRDCAARIGGWCFVLLFAAMPLAAQPVRADSGTGGADRLCARAESAEREANDYERKSGERRRFLKSGGRVDSGNGTLPAGADSAAVRQSVLARLSEVRALLPQLRRGAEAAANDRGIVPGLSQFFARTESTLSRVLQGADACLDSPRFCSVPSISCPPLPVLPAFHFTGQSADLVRQIRQGYIQSANQLRQACQNLGAGIVADVERMKRESPPAGPSPGSPGISPAQPSGDIDLYLRKAENLRREAALSRREADRVSGVKGYCSARPTYRLDAGTSRAVVESFRAAEQRRKPASDFPIDAKVIDLKAQWEKQWKTETTLRASGVPLPKVTVGEGGGSMVDRIKDRLEEYKDSVREYADRGGPGWWRGLKSAYREADEQVELTEFIKSRPKELMKDAVTELVEKSLGAYGKTVTTGYKIVSAVKTTADEVGEILTDAPRVIAVGGVDEARDLYGRAERVPLNFLNNLFDDVTGKFPPPRYGRKDRAGR